jgi:hypothetical protein
VACRERPGGNADWDKGAGENWARVLVEKETVAFVWMRAPLVILVKAYERLAPVLALRIVPVLWVHNRASKGTAPALEQIGTPPPVLWFPGASNTPRSPNTN